MPCSGGPKLVQICGNAAHSCPPLMGERKDDPVQLFVVPIRLSTLRPGITLYGPRNPDPDAHFLRNTLLNLGTFHIFKFG